MEFRHLPRRSIKSKIDFIPKKKLENMKTLIKIITIWILLTMGFLCRMGLHYDGGLKKCRFCNTWLRFKWWHFIYGQYARYKPTKFDPAEYTYTYNPNCPICWGKKNALTQYGKRGGGFNEIRAAFCKCVKKKLKR